VGAMSRRERKAAKHRSLMLRVNVPIAARPNEKEISHVASLKTIRRKAAALRQIHIQGTLSPN
jgi:hypothetical protein